MKLEALIGLRFNPPSVPRVVALLLNELNRQEVDLRQIAQLISTDPALTIRLLRLANAPSFQLSGKISSVSEALALLSLSHVQNMAHEAASSASLRSVAGIDLQQFWSYSLNVAKVSRALAGLVRQNQQAAFTCGLIHAVGELVMHIGMSDSMVRFSQTIPPLNLRRADGERAYFGYCYAGVGAAFARMWKFPQMLIDALEHQYAPFENEVYEPLAGVIHLATWRARCKEAHMSEREMAVTFPSVVGDSLGLDIDMVLQQDPFDWLRKN